jgi:PAS domain S-box-containing protein
LQPNIGHGTRTARDDRRVWLLIAAVAFVVVSVVAITAWMLYDAHRAARENAVRSSDNIAAAFATDIKVYDLSLQAVIDGLKLDYIWSVSKPERDLILFDRATTARHLGGVIALDEQGDVVIDSMSKNPRTANFADRDYFTIHRDNPHAGLFVSAPFVGRLTGGWTIAISRRMEHLDGSFAGAVVGTLRLDLFREMFDAVDPGYDAAISLLHTNKTLVLRKPYVDGDTGRSLSGAALWQDLQRARHGRFADSGVIEAIDRIFVYRRIGDLPFVVAISLSEDRVFAEWRQKALIVGTGILGLIAVAVLLVALFLSELRRRDRAERNARESEREYRILADNSTDMIVRTSVDGVRRYLSPACRTLLGYEPAELLGTHAASRVHPDDLAAMKAAFTRLRSGSEMAIALARQRRKDGSYVWIEGNMRLTVDAATGEREIVSVVRDVGAREAAAEELRRAKIEAETANRAKSSFLANMSHELRTPLNAVIGFSDLIERAIFGPLGHPRYSEYAGDIRSSGQHLLELINDLLDHAKAESGKLELDEEPVDIAASVEFVVRMLTPRAERAGLTLLTSCKAVDSVVGDERRLRQALLNLVTNAVKFTPAGGQITIATALAADGDLLLTVSDTGIGIAEEDRLSVLEPFAQARDRSGHPPEGTGLGLPLTKRLVELHGGSLELTSAAGRGTTVIIRLPAARLIKEPSPGNVVALFG